MSKETAHVANKVAFGGEVIQWLNQHAATGVIAQEHVTTQHRLTIDHHAAGAANSHATRPAVAEGWVKVFLDIGEGIKQRGAGIVGHAVALLKRSIALLG